MRPYNVEIFDRDLNYIYSTLINNSDFAYSEDYIDPKKNVIAVPTTFNPKELAGNDVNAPKGWYIRINDGENEFQGIISAFETGEVQNYITYAQMITLVNLQMLVATSGITLTNIETYIKNLIVANFINTTDNTQKIQGLTSVTTTTATTGTFNFNDEEEDQTIIDFLDDLIYPAFELYGILTEITFDPQQKKINITVGKNTTSAKIIEADLPNAIDKSFTLRRSDKEVNKVSVIDTENGQEYRFFLHPDGTFDQSDTNRIDPVVNAVIGVKGQTLAENYVDAIYRNYINIISGLESYDGTLSNTDYASYQTAINVMAPKYISNHPLTVPEISSEMSGATITNSIGSTSYSTSQTKITQVNSSGKWNSNGSFTVNTTQGLGHCILKASVTTQAESGSAIARQTFEYQKYFNSSMANTAFKDYKTTQAYKNEVAAVLNNIVLQSAFQQATKTFARNKYSNLIELSFLENDAMVTPKMLKIGRQAHIIHDGVEYVSLLSGKEMNGGKITLTFGTIRLELTSFLKGRY
jgi:hypothetical protein